MKARYGWMAAIAVGALVTVGTAVMVVGRAVPLNPEAEGRNAGPVAKVAAATSAPGDTGVARGGSAPKGQAPVVALTVPRFENAFNAEAGDTRLLVMLSPT